jgi:hypothetical protein
MRHLQQRRGVRIPLNIPVTLFPVPWVTEYPSTLVSEYRRANSQYS